ncbi:MAG: hypothetical protein QXM08_04010 [Thermofilaceae archaeon]
MDGEVGKPIDSEVMRLLMEIGGDLKLLEMLISEDAKALTAAYTILNVFAKIKKLEETLSKAKGES